MTGPQAAQSLHNLGRALKRLREAHQEPEANSLVVDGTIQRFEFVIELYWKTLRRLLAAEGILANTLRESLQQAYQAQWLTDETAWLEMLQDWNESSHTYDEVTALRIYANIKRNFPELERIYTFLPQWSWGTLVPRRGVQHPMMQSFAPLMCACMKYYANPDSPIPY